MSDLSKKTTTQNVNSTTRRAAHKSVRRASRPPSVENTMKPVISPTGASGQTLATFPEKPGTFSYNDSLSIYGMSCEYSTTQWVVFAGGNDTGAVLAAGTGSTTSNFLNAPLAMRSIKVTY